MLRFVRVLWQLPLATLAGAAVGLLAALIAAVLSVSPLRATSHPLLAFALSPLPAVAGAWLDWARLYRPSPRTRFWSLALFGLSLLAAIEAALYFSDGASVALALAPALPLGAALVVYLGTRTLLLLSSRGRGLLGFELALGTIRRDEAERILLDTPDGVVELDRRSASELGPNRALDLSTGAPLCVLGRLRDVVKKGDPFRTERRSAAHAVLGIASSPRDLRVSTRARARAWVSYLLLLALGSAAFAAAAGYDPGGGSNDGCPTRSVAHSGGGATHVYGRT